jgi:hypothetical protein
MISDSVWLMLDDCDYTVDVRCLENCRMERFVCLTPVFDHHSASKVADLYENREKMRNRGPQNDAASYKLRTGKSRAFRPQVQDICHPLGLYLDMIDLSII